LYIIRAEYQTAHAVAEQLLTIAQAQPDPVFRLRAHTTLAGVLFYVGELAAAQVQAERGIALYDRQQYRSLASLYGGYDPGLACLCEAATVQLLRGYPDQAIQRGREALALAQELAHPLSRAYALTWIARVHLLRREWPAAEALAEALIMLATEQGFTFYLAEGTRRRGFALAGQGRNEEGIAQMHQSQAALQATGAELDRRYTLAQLADAYGQSGQAAEGLALLAEALASVTTTGEHYYEPELYRFQGELLLALSVERQTEAAACFQQALAVARRQQARWLELRAAMSLVRLWQQQGKPAEAHALLTPIYDWFTEGFDTADLQEARALLEALQ